MPFKGKKPRLRFIAAATPQGYDVPCLVKLYAYTPEEAKLRAQVYFDEFFKEIGLKTGKICAVLHREIPEYKPCYPLEKTSEG